jgi:quercetin dioxygenase-like cupin family protein
MRSVQLLGNLEFHDNHPHAQPLLVSDTGRVLRFTLKPGQTIREHSAPASPFYVVVLQGEGMFAGGDKKEQKYGPNSLVVFDPGEPHSVRALAGELVFVGFLQGVPGTSPGKVAGEITQK